VAELVDAPGLGPGGRKPLEVRVLSPALAVALVLVASAGAAPGWQPAAPVPVARTEVAAARVGDELFVVGGYLANGTHVGRVDAYSPRLDRWRRAPSLPVGVDHAAAAARNGKLYVVGGYGANQRAYVLEKRRWRRLRDLPAPRAAAGAAIVGTKLYVVGGVAAPTTLARNVLVLDLRTGHWSFAPGPTRREHLAVTARGRTVYALAGRSAGTNFDYLEAYTPGARRWRPLPPIPDPRGGTGAAVVGTRIVSVGGEEAAGTIAPVYAYDVARRRWSRLADMRTPRHGLGVVAFGGRVYALAGGPQPGLHVSAANEFLRVR
jgi:N-acetylneuraminic acid mutarotase